MSNFQTDNTAFVLHQNKEFQLSLRLEFIVFYMVSETFEPARKERKRKATSTAVTKKKKKKKV